MKEALEKEKPYFKNRWITPKVKEFLKEMKKKNNRNDTVKENLKEISEFLELAKAYVNRGVALGQEFDGFHVAYDGYWTRYRVVGNTIRCQIPEETSMITELPECARDCWKLLMFRRKTEDIEASVALLIPLLKSGEIKSFKHNGDVRKQDAYVIVIYTWGTEERDKLKAKLHSIGFTNIPYRRGCKMFESRFGHWKQWFKDEE